MRKAVLFLTVALLGLAPSLSFAAEASASGSLSDAQRAEVEGIIKEYLTNKHPEVMAQGLQTLQKREQETAEAKSKEEITAAKDKIFNDPSTPTAGNPKGNVTIVEFYDYQCGYCKMAEEVIDRILKEDKNVKFIFKDFPILGAVSAEASKASLASVKQGKFLVFHQALMNKKEHLTSETIYQVAKEAGLDVEKLKKDMTDNALNDALNGNIKLGQDIGVRGTPLFIINENIFPGAIQYDQLKKAIGDARGESKKP